MKNFALTGVAGYIAPRHLKAIKDTGNNLIAAVDPHDSVGILDRYFPDASFFTEIERFDRYLEKLKRYNPENKIDYMSICTPNYLHDSHIRLALRLGADAICEKPIVIKPSSFEMLYALEEETGQKINTILQLRVHPSLVALRETIQKSDKSRKKDIVLTYITARGAWYKYSWKHDKSRSGGVATNIGIHFFDMLVWFFGNVQNNEVYMREKDRMSGYIELENANVRWFLSINRNDLPEQSVKENKMTYRSITVDDVEVEFTEGFTDLHTVVYQKTLMGAGFGLDDAKPSIELVNDINHLELNQNLRYIHPFLIK